MELRWFDHWLKGIDTGFMDEPPVKLEIRTGGMHRSEFRMEDDWPIPRTQWTKMYLKIEREPSDEANGVEGPLVAKCPEQTGKASYGQSAPSRP